VDAFRAENPTCVRLVRGSSELRAAVPASAAACVAAPPSADVAAVIASAPHRDRLLFVRGTEASSVTGGGDLSSITLVLEAPTAAVCAAWAAAGSSLGCQWESLLRSTLSRGDEATAVKELLSWMEASSAPAARDEAGAVAAVLGANNRRRLQEAATWLNAASPAAGAVASVLRKGGDSVDAVTGVPVVGPALRLALLVVQAGALTVRADEHNDLRVAAAKNCGEVVRLLLERTLDTLRLAETEFASVHVTQLCGLLGQAEAVMEEVEGTVFSSGWKAALQGDTMRRWEGTIDALYTDVLGVCAVGTIGLGLDELKRNMSAMRRSTDAAPESSADSADLDAYDLGWRAATTVPGYVPGVDNPDRAEYTIVQALVKYKASGGDKAPRVGICAIGGSGKSTACAGLAASALVRQHFSVVWIHLGDAVSPQMLQDAVVALTLRFCGRDTARRLLRLPADADVVGIAARYVQSVGVSDAAKWLVVVDDVVYRKHDWLLRLLQVVPTATPILFTTRSVPVVPLVKGAQLVSFDALPARDAKALLAEALARPANSGKPPFSPTEEEAWVDSVLDMTGRHALSLSIIGAVVAAKRGAWQPVLKSMKEQLKHLDFSLPPGGLDSPLSVRATLATSLALLPNETCRSAFAAVGVLPTSVLVSLPVLSRLWRLQLEVANAPGQSQADDDLGTGGGVSGSGSGNAVAARDVGDLVDVLVGAGLLRHESDADRGVVAGVVVHPVIGSYARSLLGDASPSTHRRLLVDEYLAGVNDGCMSVFGWSVYPFWDAPHDDGYLFDNVARHAAASRDVAALLSLVHDEWRDVRVRTCSPLAYQGDVEVVLVALLRVVKDADREVRQTPALLCGVLYSIAIAYRDRIQGSRGDNVEAAIQHLQGALELVTRDAAPSLCATVRRCLGSAFGERIRGDRGDNMEVAIRCYRAALEVHTREAAPLDWAATQNNLGNAYDSRVRGDRRNNVEVAIGCYRAALEVHTREAAPLKWAATQNNLGSAYDSRVRGDRGDNVEAAIGCYRAALEVRTREAAPLDWATTQYNLGNAYGNRVSGDRGDNVEAAIGCYRAALEVRTREAAPLKWAATQNNLGSAYDSRVSGDRGDNVEAAIGCYRAALEVRTREAAP